MDGRKSGRGAALILPCAILAAWLACGPAAAGAPARNGPLVTCIAAPSDFADLAGQPAEQADDEDETDASAPQQADWPGRGIGSLRGDCLFLTGEVSAGWEFTRYLGRSARLVGPRLLPGTVSTILGSFALTHVTPSAGTPLVTRLAIDLDGDGAMALTDASIAFGPVLAGLSASMFDVWSGDEFSFRALASSQSPALLAARLVDRPEAGLILSLEDPSFRRITLGGYGGLAVPDMVLRGTLRRGPAQFVLSAAWRQTRLAGSGADTLHGHALQGSLRLDLPALSDETYLIAQVAHARHALGYLGINTRTNTLGIVLPGVLGAAVAERGEGTSGAFALVHQIAPDWRIAAFASGSRIVLERDCGGCRVTSLRGAANLAWTPSPGLEVALEVGASRTASMIPLLLPGRRWSTILSLSRSF